MFFVRSEFNLYVVIIYFVVNMLLRGFLRFILYNENYVIRKYILYDCICIKYVDYINLNLKILDKLFIVWGSV